MGALPRTLRVLARGATWAVVDKPSGLAVHPSVRVRDRVTAIDIARSLFDARVAPVHRIDRATSGCLLLSLVPEATGALHAALVAGRKRYVAFVRGNVSFPEGFRFDQPLSDDDGVHKDAVTEFAAVAGCDEPRSSLVVASPLTGRTHQIRRHLRDLSHPVLGDSSHGDTRVNRVWREGFGLGRLALHHLSITLDPPEGPIRVVSPLPADLRSVGERLPWWGAAVAALPELTERRPESP